MINSDSQLETDKLIKLVGDIGGTNARFAFLNYDGVPTQPTTLHVNDYPTIVDAIRSFMSDAGIDHVDSVAIAVATPITSDQVRLTNGHWSFSQSRLKSELGCHKLCMGRSITT